MARGRRHRHRTTSRPTPGQAFELNLGPGRGGRLSAFADDAARREAWELHREYLHAAGFLTTWADAAYGPGGPA